MSEHELQLGQLLWFIGWLAVVTLLFVAALRLPIDTRLSGPLKGLYGATCVAVGVGVWVLANVALVLNDTHIDLTREKTYTPSAAAMAVVDGLKSPARITYFYRSQDAAGRRANGILQVMARRNSNLTVVSVDPDKQPEIARREGVRLYNAAVIEAAGRRVLIQGTDEAEIAIGIQRVLRETAITVCFVEGHGEFAMDGFEFHSHLEGATNHSHGEASSHVIETSGHGVGRLRRALEAQGYLARKLLLATASAIPKDCTLIIIANPRTTFLPGESTALRSFLTSGGNALLLFDLGFELEPNLAQLVSDLGGQLEQEVVVDPLSHYQTDAEMVAVTGYEQHAITRTVSLTFFPGIRPISRTTPASGVTVVPLMKSSRDSYARSVAPVATRMVADAASQVAQTAAPVPTVYPRLLGLAAEGSLLPGAPPFRAVLFGDGDFASNSFLPYMANSDLLLAAVRWLTREERSVAVKTRIPVPPTILLTGTQSRWLFLSIVILLPSAVVGMGGFVWWWRR